MNNRQKKGLYQNLHQLFDQGITVNHISEELQFVPLESDAIETKKMLNENDFDTIGIANHGRIIGYVKGEELDEGRCSNYMHRFEPEELVSDSIPLINLLWLFKDKERVFILERNNINKIVVLADLQKPPVRMLILA
ncbi:hypothetical protein ACFOLK_16900 [Marinococcus halophilus]|uniref:hypothetical protein n=1 Tax=Marinococcus halophilus TaxID=1371 RepID=UPI00361078C2